MYLSNPKQHKALKPRHCIPCWVKLTAALVFGGLSATVTAADYQLTTPANDDGQGNLIFLDRHYLDCGSDGLSALALYRPSATQIAYNYQCTELSGFTNEVHYTPQNDDGGGNVVYLDRHTINCEGKPLQFIHLERPTSDSIRYHYKCGDKKLLGLTDYFTNADEDGGGNAVYLDRQAVACPQGEVLSYLRLERPTSNTMRYHFKCGEYDPSATYGFTNDFAADNWSVTGVANSTMTTSALVASVASGGGGVTASITIPTDGKIFFDWDMQLFTAGQYGDVIRYKVNGTAYDLSTSGSAQGAITSLAVSGGDLLQFETWGTTQSSSYIATFDQFIFVADKIAPQCAFAGDNQGRNDPGFSGQTFVYQNSSYGTNRFMWDGINKGEVTIGNNSVTDSNGNVFTLGALVSQPYSDVWYYEICVNMP